MHVWVHIVIDDETGRRRRRLVMERFQRLSAEAVACLFEVRIII